MIFWGNKENKFTNVFKWFAGISYPLYLIHQNIGYAIIRGFVSIGWTNEIIVLVPIAVSILLAWLIHQFIEIPIAKLQRKKKKQTD